MRRAMERPASLPSARESRQAGGPASLCAAVQAADQRAASTSGESAQVSQVFADAVTTAEMTIIRMETAPERSSGRNAEVWRASAKGSDLTAALGESTFSLDWGSLRISSLMRKKGRSASCALFHWEAPAGKGGEPPFMATLMGYATFPSRSALRREAATRAAASPAPSRFR